MSPIHATTPAEHALEVEQHPVLELPDAVARPRTEADMKLVVPGMLGPVLLKH